MSNVEKDPKNEAAIEHMFKVGAHFGYSRSRRHPSAAPYIFGAKNRVEIVDLEQTKEMLDKAKDFVRKQASLGAMMLLVGGKSEARDAIKNAALSIDMPYVAGRWIGGSLTNFSGIRARVDKYLDLLSKREKGELSKYTKKERLLIDREIVNLERYFLGLVTMRELPKFLFVIDSKREKNAVAEAKKTGIPVVALVGSDCDLEEVGYPILANDSSIASITFFVNELAEAYREGKQQTVNPKSQISSGSQAHKIKTDR